jgi:hypothetical protein
MDDKQTHAHRTPIDDGLSGQAKNLIAGKYREIPAFHVMFDVLLLLFCNAVGNFFRFSSTTTRRR